ncbi:Uncharacterized membrane protein YgdD, TMEM256/DUF423 family [Marininema mesophilum]|uniref:Uncharacterized membrane protein YgdD, TMEM256/DUF423 family n=1 Tax=Marininema mesophilum TaxID=1048340 RepID=A0A1H3ATI8_9BACL|nr:DUF423 domain-containing protein [Marininema mesophilum]SDX32718.1 Uncharacterized membrane protein YgdD, TMEM256/DUF423 family [Marininema mesophilum]
MKLFIFLGAVNMFLAVALGAFGAHGLEGKISDRMIANWQTGALYHMIHALALLFIGLLAAKVGPSPLVTTGGWLIFAGIVCFSGSLYAIALTGTKVIWPITPTGGLAFLVGWACIAIAAIKKL